MAEPTSARPFPITLVCTVAWVGYLWTLEDAFSGPARAFAQAHHASWFPVFMGVSAALGLLCFVGFWRMRRVGVLGFILLVAVQNAVLLATHLWAPQAILFPVIPTLVGLGYMERMA